jgi:molybdopterin-guanine dinucleotide biosynthesis protein A
MTDAATRPLDALLLAGGRASRLGGVSKPELEVGGRTLLQHAIEASHSVGARRIVVVGPPSLEAPGCLVVREDPPFGGPVAAIAAGLTALDLADAPGLGPGRHDDAASDVLVLACDLPTATAAVATLFAHRADRGSPGDGADDSGGDGACLVDADGRRQWLTAVYSRAALARAFGALGHPADGAAMRQLVASLDLAEIADTGNAGDIDTWSDLDRARAHAHARARAHASGPRAEFEPTTDSEPPEEHLMNTTDAQPTPADLDAWVAEVAATLGLEPADVPIGDILDLTRRVAHGVARPAGPLTAFMLGLAIGRGTTSGSTIEVAGRLGDLAER